MNTDDIIIREVVVHRQHTDASRDVHTHDTSQKILWLCVPTTGIYTPGME